ncbi:hypothetical protein CVT25_002432 [Psilocybe cyanescens]|uniref:Uncharacterized protein n=1 Tax=Psilocybe cyanescens TaxID=93625 RepID=A0A409WK10_PSICY|nr:hypothetical protein CVT25_002432 [Psilocybe cyanescens]
MLPVMPWIDTILEQFQIIDTFTTDESEYYGPYNTLLTDLFPHIEHYQRYTSFESGTDQQMRDQYENIVGQNLVVPKLYAISAMGTRFSVYEYDKETNAVSPPSISRHPTFMTDVAPASRWNYELLDDVGEQKMRELVLEVKRMCQDIIESANPVPVFCAQQ